MYKVTSDRAEFMHQMFELYAKDVTFQETTRSSENDAELKRIFSWKYSLYVFHVEVAVLLNFLAIGYTRHARESVSDIEVF